MLKENKLVFLISQPRSGSTLLQKLLSQNSKIYTQAEPWIMLHPAYSLKSTGIYAEYNKINEKRASYGFINNLPSGGREVYLKRLQSMYLSLYADYLKYTGKSFFLDKTPRYYFIWKELREIFPNARYLVLSRNPLSVLYSIIMTWNNENWFRLSEYKHDLKTAIVNLEEMNSTETMFCVKYEDLVDSPENELQNMSSYIGIPFEKNMLSYDKNEKWEFGDQDYISSRINISPDRKRLWENIDLSQQTWRVLSDYLEWIGSDRMAQLGYDYDVMRHLLDSKMPAKSLESLINNTYNLESLLDSTKNCLIENNYLRNEILKQEKEIEYYAKIRFSLDKHIKSGILKKPIAKLRSYKNMIDSFKAVNRKNEE